MISLQISSWSCLSQGGTLLNCVQLTSAIASLFNYLFASYQSNRTFGLFNSLDNGPMLSYGFGQLT